MTDYCTFWLEGWWSQCCQAHDADYAAQVAKDIADAALFQCVAASSPTLAVASTIIGGAMYVAVRIFGGRFYRNAAPKK